MRSWNGKTGRSTGGYPVVFFDALRVKIRDEGLVKNKVLTLT